MLDGLRVLDFSDESGFLAGKVLGDLGADVVKVEPPGGDRRGRRAPYLHGEVDPERSLAWLALNTSKRGITLAPASRTGHDLARRLAERADVVLDTTVPGMAGEGPSVDALCEANPRLVACSITPFGRTGPRAHWRAGDLVAVAMGGNLHATGDPDRPPVRCSMPTAFYHAAPEAALGILMALYQREDTGRGQRVDVSLQETQLQSLLSAPGQFALHGRAMTRSGARLGRTREIWAARDGQVSFGLRGGPARVANLVATVEWMAERGQAPDWLRAYDWQSFSHLSVSDEEIARLEEAFGAFFATQTMRELYDEALARRILLAPCNDARELLAHPQLRSREFFVTLDYPELGASIEHPDFFARTADRAISVRRRAPRIGEHNAEIYGELGLGPDDLVKLGAEGAI
ncbi:MAG: CoA transferase [Deltaproteobacteria bacterium]|nr:CoA transferase [Deltaproteobacteria bacterium]MBW2447497.1 CoA transferase [Deltaproteobacteria bacterium]